MNEATADNVIVGALAGTILLATIRRVTKDQTSRGPAMTTVVGGTLVAVPLLVLADFEPGLAASFAGLIFVAEFLGSKDILDIAGNVLKAAPGKPGTVINTDITSVAGGPNLNVQASGKTAQAIGFALAQLGKPYSHNPDGTTSFDCSLLMQKAFAAAGISIPRTTFEQVKAGVAVDVSQMKPGDLIFTKGLNEAGQWVDFGHVGMYLGNNQWVEAPRTGDVVKITTMPSNIQAVRRYS